MIGFLSSEADLHGFTFGFFGVFPDFFIKSHKTVIATRFGAFFTFCKCCRNCESSGRITVVERRACKLIRALIRAKVSPCPR